MKIQDFLKDEIFTIPKTYLKGDYKQFINSLFVKLVKKVEDLNSTQNKFENLRFSVDSILKRQKHLVNKLKEAINYYYEGKPSKAYESINKGLSSDVKEFREILNIRRFNSNSNFYRIRFQSQNFPLAAKDFFHIPFEQRGKVKTQRFSIPGFPTLYLGTSIYVCWEELDRLNINNFQAIRLENIEPVEVIDLSPPVGNQISDYDYYKYLMIFPLVLASSIKVKENSDTFKPEYIIPQLLLQWIRENKRFNGQNVDGVAYQTTHIDFSKTLSQGEFLNLALPVQDNKNKGVCDVLRRKFKMTQATSIQLNQYSTGGANFFTSSDEDILLNKTIQKLELIKGKALPYSYSLFGDLERTLNNLEANLIRSS